MHRPWLAPGAQRAPYNPWRAGFSYTLEKPGKFTEWREPIAIEGSGSSATGYKAMSSRTHTRNRSHPGVLELEGRILLSPIGYTPAQIQHAYGYDQVVFDAGGQPVPGDGRGVTIALFEVGDTPPLSQDLEVFDRAFNLPDLVPWTSGTSQPAAPFLEQLGFDGERRGSCPAIHAERGDPRRGVGPRGRARGEHPGGGSGAALQLPQADAFAARQPGVAVVSNSYSIDNYLELPTELGDNASFTTPPGHPGVTFVDSSGDTGAPSHPPDYSPNVLSVGGTSLTLDAAGDYGSETAWAGSGGGFSLYERQPAYQKRVLPGARRRAVPDVAIVANKNTGVAVYNSGEGGWIISGGTSLAAPLWAAIIAIADQGRELRGLGSLDGPTQTLPDLYRLPRRDFHAITAGNNGFPAHRGYNLVTGLGSPYVDRVVAGLVASTAVYPAPRIGKPLRPPASYYATTPKTLRATAGSAFNGILATMRLKLSPQQAGAVGTSVNWGDGTASNQPPIDLNPLGFGVFQVLTVAGSPGRKIFANAGTYTIRAKLTLPSGSVVGIRRKIHVSPAPLTVAAGPIEAAAGTVFSGPVATFTDAGRNPDPADPARRRRPIPPRSSGATARAPAGPSRCDRRRRDSS